MRSSIACLLPVIRIHNYRMSLVADVNILQGSVATRLKCGGIFKYDYVANLLLSPLVEELGKSVNIWRSYVQECRPSVLFFIDSRCSVRVGP